jgi:putative two-component system response regulator
MNEDMEDQLIENFKNTVAKITKELESQDQTTGWSKRMNAYAQIIARELEWGFNECEILKYAVSLHDIGKLGVPDKILNKPEPLTQEEWKVMKEHPVVGAQIVAPTQYGSLIAPIIRAHHENWDGSGYPDGLKGEEIPEEARLIAVVNAFDMMTSEQPYRKTLTHSEAHQEIINNSGSQFDPMMVEAFQRCWERGEIQAVLKGKE